MAAPRRKAADRAPTYADLVMDAWDRMESEGIPAKDEPKAGRTIERALSEEATKRFFEYRAADPEPLPPAQCRMTREAWESFSPGMRRAITKEFTQQAPASEKAEPVDALNEHEQAMRRLDAKARL